MPVPHIEPVEQAHRSRNALRLKPRSSGAYQQECHVVYAETDGIGLTMDVFRPPGEPNGHALVDVVSGGWHADRARLNEHIGLGLIDACCAAGYTVFAVSPGSATLFSARQMVAHVHAAIRFIRWRADAWNIAPDPLGLLGVSAGGHIAALAALQPKPAVPKARQPWFRFDTSVAAVGLFFPPTDLTQFGDAPFNVRRDGDLAIPRLLFQDGLDGHTDVEIQAAARDISPRYQVTGNHPPFLLAHATGDAVVPYSQSTALVDALTKSGCHATLWTHDGEGHPWRTVGHECEKMAAWFNQHLLD